MKRLIVFILLISSLPSLGQAVKISDMPAASALGGTELFPVVQGGVNKKATGTQIQTFVGGITASNGLTKVVNDIQLGGSFTGTVTLAAGTNPFIMTTGVTTGTGATAGHQLVGNSLTTGNLFDASSSSVSSGALGVFTSTSTVINHTAGTNGLVKVLMSGANSTASKTAIGLYSKVINTGTTNTNIAGYFEASGGTTNWGIRSAGSIDVTSVGGVSIGGTTDYTVVGLGTVLPGHLFVGGVSNASINWGTSSSRWSAISGVSGAGLSFRSTSATAAFDITGGGLLVSQSITSSGWISSLIVTPGAHTARTASTAFPNQLFSSATQSWVAVAGTIAAQKDTEFRAITHSAATSGTFTNLYNVFMEAPLVGGAATATNSYALGTGGHIALTNGGTASELRFLEPSGSGANYLGFKVPALAGNLDFTWFDAYPAVNGYVLSSTTAGVMSWVASGGGSGDVVGPASSVDYEIPVFNSTTGKLLKNSFISSDASGNFNLGTSGLGGSARTISAIGLSSSIDLTFAQKGSSGRFNFNTTSGNAVFVPTGSATSFVLQGVGTTPSINLAGSTTNGGLTIQSITASSGDIQLSPSAAATYFLNIVGSAPAAATGGPVSLIGGSPTGGNNIGGDATITSGTPSGSGTEGSVNIQTRSGAKIGFFAATPVVKQSAASDLQTFYNGMVAYGMFPAATVGSYAPSSIAADATNADFTAVVNSVKYLPAATLSVNRTITMPAGANGDVIEIFNNEAGFQWLLAGGAVYLADGATTITALYANTNYLIRKVSGKWRILN